VGNSVKRAWLIVLYTGCSGRQSATPLHAFSVPEISDADKTMASLSFMSATPYHVTGAWTRQGLLLAGCHSLLFTIHGTTSLRVIINTGLS
jgi:hypothetical protein